MGNESSTSNSLKPTSRKTSSSSEQSSFYNNQRLANFKDFKNLKYENLTRRLGLEKSANVNKNAYPYTPYKLNNSNKTRSRLSSKLTKEKLLNISKVITDQIPVLLSSLNNIDIMTSAFTLDDATSDVSFEIAKSLQCWMDVKDQKLKTFKKATINFINKDLLTMSNTKESVSIDDENVLYYNSKNIRQSLKKFNAMEEKVSAFCKDVQKLESDLNLQSTKRSDTISNTNSSESYLINEDLKMQINKNKSSVISSSNVSNMKIVKDNRSDKLIILKDKDKNTKTSPERRLDSNSNSNPNPNNISRISNQNNKEKVKNFKLDIKQVKVNFKQQKSLSPNRGSNKINKIESKDINTSARNIKSKSPPVKVSNPAVSNKAVLVSRSPPKNKPIKTIVYKLKDSLPENRDIISNSFLNQSKILEHKEIDHRTTKSRKVLDNDNITNKSNKSLLNETDNSINKLLPIQNWNANKITYAELIKKREEASTSGTMRRSSPPSNNNVNSSYYSNGNEKITKDLMRTDNMKPFNANKPPTQINKPVNDNSLEDVNTVSKKELNNSGLYCNSNENEHIVKNNKHKIIDKVNSSNNSLQSISTKKEEACKIKKSDSKKNVNLNDSKQDKDKEKEKDNQSIHNTSVNTNPIAAKLNKLKNLKFNINLSQLKEKAEESQNQSQIKSHNLKENEYKANTRYSEAEIESEQNETPSKKRSNTPMFNQLNNNAHFHRRSNSFGGFALDQVNSLTPNMYEFNPNPNINSHLNAHSFRNSNSPNHGLLTFRDSENIIGEKFSFRNNLKIAEEDESTNYSQMMNAYYNCAHTDADNDLIRYIKPKIVKTLHGQEEETQSLNESLQTENSTHKNVDKQEEYSSKSLKNLNIKERLIYKKPI